MKGYYFVNSDIANKRAHTTQMLSTAEFVSSLRMVFPKYKKKYNKNELFSYYGLEREIPVIFQSVFGMKDPRLLTFLLFDISASFFLLKQKIKKEVDFIYLRSSLFFLLTLTTRLLGIPLFYETHRKPLSWTEKIRDSFLARCAAGIVVISDVLKKYYSKYNKPVLVVHDAVSLQRFDLKLSKKEAREKLEIPSDKVLGVYIGSVSKLKGVDLVFTVAQQLCAINFEIIGLVAKEFKDKKFPPNVWLRGKKPQNEIPLYLRAADFLIISHPKSEYSQSPMKLFEYLAAGRSIISANLDNIKEVLPANGNLFFEPGNSNSLMLAIKKYLEKKEYYDGESIQNIEIAKKYTWQKRGEKISKFIEQTL